MPAVRCQRRRRRDPDPQTPDSLFLIGCKHGKYLTIGGVRFAYGHEHLLAALDSNVEYARYRREHGEKAARATSLGQAISYRFKRDGKGWRVFATTGMMDVPVVTDKGRGAIGVDLNAGHLAVAETDVSGNPVKSFSVPLVTYGKSRRQAEAIIGDAVASVVAYARRSGQAHLAPLSGSIFGRRRPSWRARTPGTAGCCPASATGRSRRIFLSRGYREGVEVHQVNPAFSSVIGRVKFMERYGLSVHQAAALVLARRLLGCSAQPAGASRRRCPFNRCTCRNNRASALAFTGSTCKEAGDQHVWTCNWGAVSGQLWHQRPALCSAAPISWESRQDAEPIRSPSGYLAG